MTGADGLAPAKPLGEAVDTLAGLERPTTMPWGLSAP